MTIREQALTMACEGERLLGVLSTPGSDVITRDSGVVIIAGGPQVRCGSHRQFVHLARAMATEGWPTLRFDVRGMGDSSGEPRSFEHIGADIGAAVDALCTTTDLERVLLWGLCDGASAALLYVHECQDRRVAGLSLVNPWVRSAASQARTQMKHYYVQRLLQPGFWRKLMSGGVKRSAVEGLWANLRAARRSAGAVSEAFQTRMARGWQDFNGPIQLVLSGNDFTAREFVEYTAADANWAGLCALPRVARLEIDRADHTFSDTTHRLALEQGVAQWWQREAARA